MKRTILYFAAALAIAASASAVNCAAQVLTDEEVLAAIRENPVRAAANLKPYQAPDVSYTPAPKGYKAFYVSHIGRHGSRFQIHTDTMYDAAIALLDSLHNAKALTLQGDSLRTELVHILKAHDGMAEMLTRKGAAEHSGIAGRLVARCPSVFKQKDRNIVYCSSTGRQRTIQSMAGFIAGLNTADNDKLEFSIGCSIDMLKYPRPEDKSPAGSLLTSIIQAKQVEMAPKPAELEALQARLFNGYKAPVSDLFNIYRASATAYCLGLDVDPFRFFTPEELFAFFKEFDIEYSVKYGTYAPTRAAVAKGAKAYVRLIVDEADKALAGNGHCADFRFAHDGNVGPMMNLLGIGGYEYTAEEDAPYRYWQSYNQICMASNLQLEFYRNSKSEVLVKALFNEKEVTFPGLGAVNGVYYKWSDVRRYMIGKCEDLREVPEYYKAYLDGKAERIRQLQKDELEGFYYITDMHFPSNNGNAAALIEKLENSAENRLIVFGGDAITSSHDLNLSLAMQISALEQMRGVSPILWSRGNHDIMMNVTDSAGNKGRESFPAWESVKLYSHYRPLGTVSNADDPYTSYCYYDDASKKVRYVVFDTTDTVQDNGNQSGLSSTQLRWIVDEAILNAPKGYGFIFIAHKPLIGDDSLSPAKDALSAFSTHSTFSFDGRSYDFGTRPDLRMFCLMCGHKHKDYSSEFPGGQPQINVTADSSYDYLGKTKGTTDEQAFEYVSISKDGRISVVRIGMGEDREFQL